MLPFLISLVDGFQTIDALITQGESDVVEFKETARFNLRANKRTPEMEDAIVRTIAASATSGA
jgi:hypothetical protein